MKPLQFAIFYLISCIVFSCKNDHFENDRKPDNLDKLSYSGLTGDTVKLVKTARLNFKVHNITETTRSISKIAGGFDGMVFDQDIDYEETSQNELRISTDSLLVITAIVPKAELTVRVPAQNLEAFMQRVEDLGYFIRSSEMHIDDQSVGYLESLLKQTNRKETLSKTPRLTRSFTPANAIAVKDELTELQIKNRMIDANARYSFINLSLSQSPFIRREVVSNSSAAQYQLPFGLRLSNAVKDGWHYFIAFLLMLAHLWVFALVGLAVFVSYRFVQQKRSLRRLHV